MKIGKHHITPTWGDIVLFKNKSFEYQFEFGKDSTDDIIGLRFNFNDKADHAGITFSLGLFKNFWMNLNIHDHRHWDEEHDCWKNEF